jgi:hypothetical protein
MNKTVALATLSILAAMPAGAKQPGTGPTPTNVYDGHRNFVGPVAGQAPDGGTNVLINAGLGKVFFLEVAVPGLAVDNLNIYYGQPNCQGTPFVSAGAKIPH